MTGIARITGLRLTVDLKEITDSGIAEVTDANAGVFVPFNKPFADIKSLIAKATYNSSFPVEAFWDFEDSPNPTGFQVYILRTDTGAKVTGRFSWQAEGV